MDSTAVDKSQRSNRMAIKLHDSELRIMDILWKAGDTTAKDIARTLGKQVGWSRTTSYTVIKKCIDKKAIVRIDPGFICHALVSQEETRAFETAELIDKLFDGSSDLLVASLLGKGKLSAEHIQRLKQVIEEMR